ncbi:AEC family transporter [Streptomyces radicis]|uniref:AEC family transporter n=1 Tax=Streptomyces radicis TaxID=1750517 RepID=A0A3A9W1T9_9ACTN|nr:AEC family transporter [Streptomyces radicis]RKN07195.1 AEC family transporter [Streptomyces radicis]RKN26786.1 AEC family transporter [Streptomyces radicis]
MGGVITGFAIIATVIATGYLLGRRGSLGDNGREVLTRLGFHVATPALLFVTLAHSDPAQLFSPPLLLSAIATLATAGVFIAVGALRRWGAGRTTIGALCSSYVNAGNLGIPIAVYVLGDASLVAPILLFQQLVLSPVALTVLDLTGPSAGRRTPWQRITTPFRNPVVLGSLAGVSVALSGWTPPGVLLEPATLLGNMAVPAVLLAFGISLRGSPVPGRGPERGPVLLSVVLKSWAQPLIAWALATWVFDLSPDDRLNVVVTAALPAAQNLFTYASHYGTAPQLARESILLSTALSVPTLTVTAALLG